MAAREHFGGRVAVVMAMAGSAIGLGNIWRFPYVLGQNGGAAFLLVYVLSCFLLALPIFCSETVIGRRSRANTFGAMEKLSPGTPWKWLGLLTIISPLLILSYYSVVGGWSVEYFAKSLSFDFDSVNPLAAEGFFDRFISSTWKPVLTHTVFLGITAGIVLFGVKKGIERFSKWTIPALFVLIVAILIYSLSLPGSGAGVEYLFHPDFSKLGAQGVSAAMGQAFFSMSLGVGTIRTYASYVKKEEDLVKSGFGTALFDLGFALLAGFAVMPAVFAAGLAPQEGPSLVFQTLPFIFTKMGSSSPWLGALVSIIFFLSILVAALTSSISMMEVGVAYLVEEKKMKRTTATLAITAFTWALGVLCSLSLGVLGESRILGLSIFDFLDRLCSNWLLPAGGLLFTLFVGWKMKKADVWDEITNSGTIPLACKFFPVIYFLIRFVAPVGIFIVFISPLLF